MCLSFDPWFNVLTSIPLVQGPMVAEFLRANINPEKVVHSGLPSFQMGSNYFPGRFPVR